MNKEKEPSDDMEVGLTEKGLNAISRIIMESREYQDLLEKMNYWKRKYEHCRELLLRTLLPSKKRREG